MHKLKIAFLALLVALLSGLTAANAESPATGQPATSSNAGTILKLKLKKPAKRLEAPSRVCVTCYCTPGLIEFDMPENVYNLSVSVANDVEEYTGIVTVSNPVMVLPDISGEYNVECTADDGRVFYGSFTF